MAGMQVIVDNLLIHYELRGDGKLVILLHGWGDSSQGLESLIRTLSKQYMVLAIDLPGFGGSQAPKSVWDLDNYADFLAQTLLKLDLKNPFAIIGHSNGGAIAMHAMAQSKIMSQKLILLGTAGIRNKNTSHKLLYASIAKIGKAGTVWLPKRQKHILRKKLYGAAGSDMLLMPALEETFKKIVNQDIQIDAAKLTVPTLLIFAQNDNAVPIEDGKKLHQLIEGSKLEILQDSGHFVHLDQPEKVQRLIGEFLK
jgi:pimeloyl-ACP methyl ester carboxylesterase